MTLQINGYNAEDFKKHLPTTAHYKKIQELLDKDFKVSYDKTYDGKTFWEGICTPRELYYYPRFTVNSLYYIDFLAEKNPDKIIDIGCGMNVWKQFYPNIVGIDYEHPKADIIEKWDDDFVERHEEEYECAMSMGCVMFTSFAKVEDQFHQFIRTIKHGGRGFLSINVARSIAHYTEKQDMFDLLGKERPSTKEVSDYCDQMIENLPGVKLLVVDNVIEERYNEYIDGNLRIVFERD